MPANAKPQAHGTDAGYQQHQRRKTPICEPCQEAHRRHNQYYKNRKYLDEDMLFALMREAESTYYVSNIMEIIAV